MISLPFPFRTYVHNDWEGSRRQRFFYSQIPSGSSGLLSWVEDALKGSPRRLGKITTLILYRTAGPNMSM